MNTAHTRRPRFRTDLVAQPLDEGGQRFVDVTDPDSGKTFRFYEVEYSIACAMNGQRDLAGLVEWAQAELGLAPAPEELETVISTLADLGYLDTGSQGAGADDGAFDLGFAGASLANDDEESLPSGGDFELGTAGKSPLESDQEDRLEAASLTLGLSGNETVVPPSEAEQVLGAAPPVAAGKAASQFETPPTPPPPDAAGMRAVLRPMTPAGQAPDEDDGPTNLPPPASDFDDEMSVDLTEHMRIGTADVQEAIRQSRAIQAVEAPSDVAEQEPEPAQDDVEESLPPQAAAARTQERPPVPPTELPAKPAKVSKSVGTAVDARDELADEVVAPVAASGGSRTLILLIVLLLLVAVAAGAYFYLPSLMKGDAAPEDQGATSQTVVPEKDVPEEPAAPEVPSARLTLGEVEPVELKAERESVVIEILASGEEVEEGAVVAKLNGYQDIEKDMEKIRFDQQRYEKRIADNEEKKSAAEGNASAVKRYQREIDRTSEKLAGKTAELEAKQKELDAFLVKAPIAGTLETSLQAKTKVDAEQVLFLVKPPPNLEATFRVSDDVERSEGQEIAVAPKAEQDKKVECEVAKVDGGQVTVSCPSDGELAEGTEVVLL